MKCGGHVGRSHAKILNDLKSQKTFYVGYISRYKADFHTVECVCKSKMHSTGCGCFIEGFIESARRNLYCTITQCDNDISIYEDRIRNLGQYHARGIHS